MKSRITDPEVIRKQERNLFEVITENLDWDALSKIFRAHHRLSKITGMASRHGDLVALNNAVAYRLDFDVQAVLGVVFDRSGNYLDVEVDFLEPAGPKAEPAPFSKPAPPVAPEWESTQKAPQYPEGPEETIDLEQIIHRRSDMIVDPPFRAKPSPKPPPGKKMSKMASELADMISNINGKKKR